MSNDVKCSKCGSDQLTANKKGFSTGKAVAGAVLTGGIGLAAGAIGSNKVIVTCLKCGHHWEPKELAKQQQTEAVRKEVAEFNDWQQQFYTAYGENDFEKASTIYLSRYKAYNTTITDVHAAYKRQRKNDRDKMIFFAVFLLILFGFIYLIFG